MSAPRLALVLALLPVLSFAPGCDEKQPSDPKDSESDSDSSDDAGTTDHGMEGTTAVDEDSETDATGSSSVGPGSDSDSDSDATTSGPEEPPPGPPPVKPEPAEPCPDHDFWGEACTTEGGAESVRFCVLVDGAEVWAACGDEACIPGDNWDYGCTGQICAWDGEKLYAYSWDEPDCETPLVLNFDDAPLRFDAAAAAAFDVSGVGACLSTDWPTMPWLALDRDGDGQIASGRELFGSGTLLAGGERASNGFEALAELDLDRDGKLTAADPAFAELVLWSDGDDDRRGELAELTPVGAVDLVAIHLEIESRVECDERGNCGRERARFEFRGPTGELRSGEVVDVYLACQ